MEKPAAEELPVFGLTSAEIQKNLGIVATLLPQKPTTHLEKILADADLEYLGTDRFKEISHQLYRKTLDSQPDLSKKQWKENEIKFLSNHHYHTYRFLQEIQGTNKPGEPGTVEARDVTMTLPSADKYQHRPLVSIRELIGFDSENQSELKLNPNLLIKIHAFTLSSSSDPGK